MTSRVNISLDDITPHPLSSTRVLRRCFEVLERVPSAKFTLFIPTAYWRTTDQTATSAPLALSQFKGFCDELRGLPRESFEIGHHGHHHGIPGVSNNDELWKAKDGMLLGHEGALDVIDAMLEEANKAGLIDVFKPILRPPAWRMTPGAFTAARQRGIRTFALSPDSYATATYGGQEQQHPVVMYNVCPPQKPLALFEKTCMVYHACQWDANYLSDALSRDLISFLQAHEKGIEFCFIEGLLG